MTHHEINIDCRIEKGDWSGIQKLEALLDRSFKALLGVVDLSYLEKSELSVLFTDDAQIADLNAEFRGKSGATNILSFPACDAQDGVYGPLLGDLVFAFETIAKEARQGGIEFHDHLTHLMVHGILHLFGYDHIDEADAEEMEAVEIKVLALLGIVNPYNLDKLHSSHDE